jgi:hypothetical protein
VNAADPEAPVESVAVTVTLEVVGAENSTVSLTRHNVCDFDRYPQSDEHVQQVGLGT